MVSKKGRKRGGSARFREAREILREVWGSLMGRTGLVLIIVLVAVSIYALATMPSNIVQLWHNPLHWEDNPPLAPPEWVKYLGEPVAPQYVKTMGPTVQKIMSPTMIEHVLPVAGFVQIFTIKYNLTSPAFPKGLLVQIVKAANGTVESYGGAKVEPVVTAYLLVKRPDGLVVIANQPAPQKLSDLIASGVVRLSPDQVASQLAPRFNMSMASAEAVAYKLLFGRPAGNGSVKPLEGTYKIELILVYSSVAPQAMMRAVQQGVSGVQKVKMVVKGSAYGLMGTDDVGHDLWEGLLFGFPAALAVGLFGAVTAAIIGTVAGVISGYYGGAIDEFIQRTVDVLGNIPMLPILVLIGVIVQEMNISPWARLFIIIGVLVLVSWGYLAIMIRSMVLSIKSEPYIEAARAVGASNQRIMWRHILPQILPYVFANLVFSVPAAILTEAGLDILGIQTGLPTWGAILASAESYVRSGGSYAVWWWILPPGLLIGVTSIAFVFLGLALEIIVEPRLRRR